MNQEAGDRTHSKAQCVFVLLLAVHITVTVCPTIWDAIPGSGVLLKLYHTRSNQFAIDQSLTFLVFQDTGIPNDSHNRWGLLANSWK